MKQRPELIVMLTHKDVTVPDALEIFKECKDLPVHHWGFKNVGLPEPKMVDVVKAMKDAGKSAYLEVVTYDENSCQEAAKLAVKCGFDCLMGTVFHDSVWEYLKDKDILYSPFVGKVGGSPSVLEGTFDEIVKEANSLIEKGVKAFDLLAYRHKEGGEKLARRFCNEVKAKNTIAGSIGNYERIDLMFDIGASAYTMGSALFDQLFAEGSFYKNLKVVSDYMVNHE